MLGLLQNLHGVSLARGCARSPSWVGCTPDILQVWVCSEIQQFGSNKEGWSILVSAGDDLFGEYSRASDELIIDRIIE